jgi:hypothetical protein
MDEDGDTVQQPRFERGLPLAGGMACVVTEAIEGAHCCPRRPSMQATFFSCDLTCEISKVESTNKPIDMPRACSMYDQRDQLAILGVAFISRAARGMEEKCCWICPTSIRPGLQTPVNELSSPDQFPHLSSCP